LKMSAGAGIDTVEVKASRRRNLLVGAPEILRDHASTGWVGKYGIRPLPRARLTRREGADAIGHDPGDGAYGTHS
jgi:hypothetical protein